MKAKTTLQKTTAYKRRNQNNMGTRGGWSAYEFRYALFRCVAQQGKWEAPAFFWRYQAVS
jgi:hypothetical protein